MWPLWEREIDLLATQRRTVLLQSWKRPFVRTAQSDVLFADLLYFHIWLLIHLNFTWCSIRNNHLLAMIFRTSSPRNLETFNRTSGLQDSLALGLQNLQDFGCWRRSSELPVSESSEASWQIIRTCWRWLSSDQKHVFRSALSILLLAHSTFDWVTSSLESESV